MEKTTTPAATASDNNYIPRLPTPEEQGELADWLLSLGQLDHEEALATAQYAYVAVYDHYATGCPGYVGKVMSVVWNGSPSFFEVFTWQDGKMVRSERDYDQKECGGCGSKSGVYCWNCWKQWSKSEQERNTDNPTTAPALADALDTLLDVFLDGRMEALNEKEQEAYVKACAALDAMAKNKGTAA